MRSEGKLVIFMAGCVKELLIFFVLAENEMQDAKSIVLSVDLFFTVLRTQAPHFIQQKAQKQALNFKDTIDEISFFQKIKLPQ